MFERKMVCRRCAVLDLKEGLCLPENPRLQAAVQEKPVSVSSSLVQLAFFVCPCCRDEIYKH